MCCFREEKGLQKWIFGKVKKSESSLWYILLPSCHPQSFFSPIYIHSHPTILLPYLLHSYTMSAWNTDYQIKRVPIVSLTNADSRNVFFWFHSEVEDSRTCEHIFFRLDHKRCMWLPSMYVSEILRLQIEPDIIAKMCSDITHHNSSLFVGNCWAGSNFMEVEWVEIPAKDMFKISLCLHRKLKEKNYSN